MGFQMAANVRKKMPSLATLHIFDVNNAACQLFIEKNGSIGTIKIAQSAKELASDSSTIISMVPMDQHVRAVYLNRENGVIAAAGDPSRLILECSTIGIATTQEIGKEIMDAGLGVYVDTPVSGGVVGAEAATLSFFCGYSGAVESDPIAKRIRDTVSYMGAPKRVNFCGRLGAGLVCKIVNNYIGLSNIVVAAQGMAFGVRYGMDKETLYKCIKGSSGDSWVMDNAQPAPGVISQSASSNGFRAGFTPRLCIKDISLGIAAAQQVGIDATMGKLAVSMFKMVDQDPRTTVSLLSHTYKTASFITNLFSARFRISTARQFGSISMIKWRFLPSLSQIPGSLMGSRTCPSSIVDKMRALHAIVSRKIVLDITCLLEPD